MNVSDKSKDDAMKSFKVSARRHGKKALTALAMGLSASALSQLAPAPAGAWYGTVLDRRLNSAAITESSGLARSTFARSIVWTHNDSGGYPRVYAFDSFGTRQATISLKGASARDWEDISSGPGGRLWVGDIGDNGRSRSYITLYRFPEPETLTDGAVTATRFDLRYPDGAHNAEALMVNPVTGRVYVVTKSPSGGGVYLAPENMSSTSVNRLTRVASAPIKVTAASFSPDGKRFALCNYSTSFVYDYLGDRPTQVDKPSLKQGESLEFTRSGAELLMGSEGSYSPVYRVPAP